MKGKGEESSLLPQVVLSSPQTKVMIIVHSEKINIHSIITQEDYDSIIDGLNLFSMKCSCHRSDFIFHGRYSRSVRFVQDDERVDTVFSIARVYCKNCGKTHAILLSSMIPYTQLNLNDVIQVMRAVNDSDTDVDTVIDTKPSFSIERWERLVRLFKKQWKNSLPLRFSFRALIAEVRRRKQQFLQNRWSFSKDKSTTHIAVHVSLA